MPDTVTQLSFPIIVQPDREMVSYVAQIDFRGEILIKKEEIEILESKKFASLKKPVNPNGFLTYPVYPE